MEVIAIQKSALDGMQNELRELLELTENATKKRTLQTYKDKGLLPYSKLNRKNYYKRSDVQALLEAGLPYNTKDNGFTDE